MPFLFHPGIGVVSRFLTFIFFPFLHQNMLWKYCNPYLQRAPDLLHHFNLGIVKRYVSYVVAFLRATSGNAKVDEFDQAFSAIGQINGVKVGCPFLRPVSLGCGFNCFPPLLFSDFQARNLEADFVKGR